MAGIENDLWPGVHKWYEEAYEVAKIDDKQYEPFFPRLYEQEVAKKAAQKRYEMEQELMKAEMAMKRRENLMTGGTAAKADPTNRTKKVRRPATRGGKPIVMIDMPYVRDRFKELVANLEDDNCILSEEEYKELHEWLLRISNASGDARQRDKSRVGTAHSATTHSTAKSTIGELGTLQRMPPDEYLEFLDILREETARMRGEQLE